MTVVGNERAGHGVRGVRSGGRPAGVERRRPGPLARYARRILKLNFRSSSAWFGFGANSTYFWSP